MRLIKEKDNLTTIILEDGDILNICKMGKSKMEFCIKCFNNTFHIDEITYKQLKDLNEENKAIQNMKKYIGKRDI